MTTEESGDAILDVRAVSVTFGGVRAVEDISFDVRRGELLGFIGPNGAGKTSLVNALTGVYRCSPGAVVRLNPRDGQQTDLSTLPPHQIAAFGVVRTFQNLGLLEELTVRSNLLLGCRELQRVGIMSQALTLPRARRTSIAANGRVDEMLLRLDLAELADVTVATLPYGVRKRIELGRVLLMRPELLILDEPLAGMNPHEKRALMDLIVELKDRLSLSVILIEHDMAIVMSVADRILAMASGRRIALGDPDDVRNNVDVISAYLGTPSRRPTNSD